jgi:hypothetical protein
VSEQMDQNQSYLDLPGPVVFTDRPMSKSPMLALILLGGTIAALVAAIWHLAGS